MAWLVEEKLSRLFLQWLDEDAPYGDPAAEALGLSSVEGVLEAVAKSPGVAACSSELAAALRMLGLEAEASVATGSVFQEGSVLLTLRGRGDQLVGLERLLLNILIYASGVATATRSLVEAARGVNPRVRVAATRKTPPGLRLCAKRAFAAGGGDTHRWSLSDAVIIKDSHLELTGLSVAEAVRRARKAASFMTRVEVEVSSPSAALEAARAGADIVMLDNMGPGEVEETLRLLERHGLRERILVEASGGIGPWNIEDYAATGVDVVSTSYPLLSPARVDLAARMRPTG